MLPREFLFPAVLASAVSVLSPPAAAQVINPNFWVTDGPVNAVVRDGNTIYIGGDFTTVGPPTGGSVLLEATTGDRIPQFPVIDGFVYAAVPDGSGGWYVGGKFTSVGGAPRSNLAHINSSGSLLAWNPGTDGPVMSMLVKAGVVYVGGYFTTVGGQARNRIGAVDAVTGM